MTGTFMITAAFWIIVTIVTAAAACWAVVLAEQAADSVRSWRDGRAVIQAGNDEANERLPEPYRVSDDTVTRVATIIFCPLCHPGGHGRCTCVAYCGDRQCGYGPPALFSAEEAAWLEGLGVSEDEPEDWAYGQEGNEL